MGLDMYLSARKYLSDYTPAEKDVKEQISEIDHPMFKTGMKVKEISFEAMYWRKANAIHKWFVDNCQDGVDECQETLVDVARLRELVDTCNVVLSNKKKAGELLPPSAGFFFGSTDIDQYYLEDLQSTVDRLGDLINMPDVEQFSFYYQSSW
jgi:hypothetical protein